MQVFEALDLERKGLGGGIAMENGGARPVALLQAHAQAILEIDRGKQDHVSSHRSRHNCFGKILVLPFLQSGLQRGILVPLPP